jgi:hypothetical protein
MLERPTLVFAPKSAKRAVRSKGWMIAAMAGVLSPRALRPAVVGGAMSGRGV